MDAEPRWLSPSELEAWRYLSGMLMMLPGALDEAIHAHGVSFFEYSIMAGLSSAQERTLPMKQLASVCNGSLSRLSHAARRLDDRGFITRRPSELDRRVTLARLTDEGQRFMERCAPTHVDSVRALVFDRLTPEQVAQLRDIGAAIAGPLFGGPPPWTRGRG